MRRDGRCGRSYATPKRHHRLDSGIQSRSSQAAPLGPVRRLRHDVPDVGVNSPVLDDHDIRVKNEVKRHLHLQGQHIDTPASPTGESDVGGLKTTGTRHGRLL